MLTELKINRKLVENQICGRLRFRVHIQLRDKVEDIILDQSWRQLEVEVWCEIFFQVREQLKNAY